MTERQLKNMVYAYKYSLNHGNLKQCQHIITELEAENFHNLIELLVNEKYQLAIEEIEKDYQ